MLPITGLRQGTDGGRFRKVLIVDDILYVVKSISRFLSEEGYFILTATTGKEALVKCMRYRPDLVTVDQKLADMTGLRLVESIFTLNPAAPPRIVFISAVSDKDEIREIMKHGIDGYLLKPFKKAKLLETVKRLI